MDQTPMQTGRFLELLNKASRNETEEKELQVELLRQARANEAAGQNKPGETTQPASDATTKLSPSETQPDNTPVQPASIQDAPYSLSQLRQETNDAIEYLKSQKETNAILQAIAVFMQAIYWLNLAEKSQ